MATSTALIDTNNCFIRLRRAGDVIVDDWLVTFSLKGFAAGDFGAMGDKLYATIRDGPDSGFRYLPGDRVIITRYRDGLTPPDAYWEVLRAMLYPPPASTARIGGDALLVNISFGWVVNLVSVGQ